MKTDSITPINPAIQLRSIFYSLLSVIVAFGVFCWQTLLPIYEQTTQLELHYQTLLSEKQSQPSEPSVGLSSKQPKEALLNVVARMANGSHVSIQSSVYAADHQTDHLNLVITGSFNALRHFFQRLVASDQVWLLGFQMVFDREQQYSAKLELRNPIQSSSSTTVQVYLPSSTPFCTATFLANSQAAQQNYAIEDMALVGYLQVAQEPSALVRLPNLQVQTVKKGDRLGRQKAVITKLQPHQLIASHQQKIFELSMND